jgi:dimethylargininase
MRGANTPPVTHPSVDFGPRLIGTPTGTLRAAIVVRPSRSIERAIPLSGEPGVVYGRTAEQHATLVRTLRFFGVDVRVMESQGADPYECAAVEGAVLFENGAVLMRPTAMSRRGESDRLGREFTKMDVPIAGRIAAPGLLDGSDILLAGNTAFVGVGRRGNAIGRAGFTEIARAQGYNVVEVAMSPDARSLRSVASALDEATLVVACDKVDMQALEGFKSIVLERGEELGAGVIGLGERHVIASVRYRTALLVLRRAGITVEGIDLYDFEKAGIAASLLVLPIRRD